MASITEIAVKRPTLIVVIFAVLTFLGILGYRQLNYELMPKFTMPVVTVFTIYPGAAPSEVENSVTKKIEDALATVENLDEIKSTSSEGVSSVVLMLKQNASPDLAMQEAQRKVNAIMSQLPDDIESPTLNKFSFDDMPVLRAGVSANMPPRELYDIVKNEISPALSKVPGAAQVTLIGGEEREIRVNVNRERAQSYGISLLQINQAIQGANLDFPTGKIRSDEKQVAIRLAGKLQSLEDLENIVITQDRKTGSHVRLKDIAVVEDAAKDITTFNRLNGRNSIGLSIQKQNDANAVELSKLEREAMKELEERYADKGLKFDIAQDTSTFTLESANAVMFDLALAIVIVAACMMLFLHSIRNAVIVMISIPASLVSVFLVMYLLGYTLNMMSLLAISLVVGILVDDSIVVLENIYRHLEKRENPRAAAIRGRQEIGFTALAITLVDVVVFLPITFVGGIITNLLSQFSVVVVISTLMSLFVSFTLTPLLASRIARVSRMTGKNLFGKIILRFERFLTRLTNGYTKALKWSLAHKRVTILGTVLIFFAALALPSMGFIGSEFVNQGDRGEFIIQLELPKDATLAQTNSTTQKVEDYLFKNPDVVNVFSSVGTTSGTMGAGGSSLSNLSELNIKLVDKKHREHTADVFAALVKRDLESILPGVKVSSAPVSIMGTANQAPIQLSITGNNLDSVLSYANKLMDKIKSIKGTSEVKLSVETGNPEVSVVVDRDKMADLGITMDLLGATMQTAFSGNTRSQYRDEGNEYDINVVYDLFNRKNVADLAAFPVINSRGEAIRLSQFAEVKESTGPSKLERKNRIPSVTVNSQLIGASSGEVSEQITQFINTAKPPAGVTTSFEGTVKNMKEVFGNFGFALLASILFVYLIMVALYDSYLYPFVVLFSIPLAVIGAFLALALSMQPLSIFSMLGMIMLIGLVAKNAILLVDFTNQMKAQGYNTIDALLLAGKIRLRPILMTTLSMILGMMPIALASGAGAEWKNGLAWVLIGGLTSSMALTLVIVPCVYLIFDIWRKQLKNKEAKELLISANPMLAEGSIAH
jgi:hydrophobic/amphiphilic exporter-1 (mainly G- bacteria), HAE1 family